MGTLVSYQLTDSVATITMDDGKVNVMAPQMLAELGTALDRAGADRAVVVLAGRPGVFSAGFDLSVLKAGGSPASAMVQAGFELAERILSFPGPVLIACTGHAVALGSFLLLSGDYRLGAAGRFKITANEVAIGLTMPQVAIEICRHRLTPAHFTRAVTLAEVFPPDDAVTVRNFIVGRVRRCTAAGILTGDDTDIADVLVALAQGLAAQETAGWLGTSSASVHRRWDLAVRAMLIGLTRSA